MDEIFFGKKLKEYRLEYAQMGLKVFSTTINMVPSQLSKLERGKIAPPKEEEWFLLICEKLNIIDKEEQCEYLKKLWLRPFIKIKTDYSKFIPVFASDVDGKPLTVEVLKRLQAHMQKMEDDDS